MFYAFIIYHDVFCIYVFVYVYVYMFYGGLAIVGKSTFLLKYYIDRSLFCFGVGRCVENLAPMCIFDVSDSIDFRVSRIFERRCSIFFLQV